MVVRTNVSAPEVAGVGDVLLFELQDERYAVPTAIVESILRAVAVTALPAAPPVVLGVVNVRGEMAALLDLRRRFGWPDRPIDPDEHFLLLRGGTRPLLLRTDRALELRKIEPEALQVARDVVSGAEHVAGLLRLPDGVVLVYDLPALLDQSETRALDRALDRDAQGAQETA